MKNYLTFTDKRVIIKVADAPKNQSPMLTVVRVGESRAKNFKAWRFLQSIDNTYHFATDMVGLRPGRHYLRLSFGGCCCLTAEVQLGSGCSLVSIEAGVGKCC